MTGNLSIGGDHSGWVASRDFFPILPWSALRGWEPPHQLPRHGLESIAACHFTVAGFVQPADLAECEHLGLKAIMAPPRRPRHMIAEWTSLDDNALDRRVREMVATTATSEAVLGYFVSDEPGAAAFPVLSRVVAAIRRHAPDKLAYINVYPNYATIGAPDQSQLQTASYEDYVEDYVQEVRPQFLSYDNYMVLYSDDLRDEARAALYYTNLLDTRRVALEYGLPWWQVVCSNQIRRHTPVPSPANLLFQAFTTLASGGTGVGWFTYYGLSYGYAPVDGAGQMTPTWSMVQMVNRQLQVIGPMMNCLRSTGVYGSQPGPGGTLPQLPGTYLQAVSSPEPVMVGEFLDEHEVPHLMLVNLSLERSTKISLRLGDASLRAAIASVDDGQFRSADLDAGLWLVPGQGALLRLDPPAPPSTATSTT
ncbi:MAG TPA: hypothetical protein VGW38_28855 [Chloroflexota bacterium]|nr:hypothetical protein [Chloroflexota bacterium]